MTRYGDTGGDMGPVDIRRPHSMTEIPLQPGRPPRPIFDAFFLPRGLLGASAVC